MRIAAERTDLSVFRPYPIQPFTSRNGSTSSKAGQLLWYNWLGLRNRGVSGEAGMGSTRN
jgi:hypothetical protein